MAVDGVTSNTRSKYILNVEVRLTGCEFSDQDFQGFWPKYCKEVTRSKHSGVLISGWKTQGFVFFYYYSYYYFTERVDLVGKKKPKGMCQSPCLTGLTFFIFLPHPQVLGLWTWLAVIICQFGQFYIS